MDAETDIFVIGGGVNGTGIARDAAGRGYSVRLAEMGDLASGTSQAATKLIHGGLRYLEHYEFRLVREALIEREVLWRSAPHIIWPLRFVLPYEQGLRPAWLLRLGLFLYDHIGGRRLLPGTRTLDLATDEAGSPLRPGHSIGFEYSDGWVDDARLVVLNALDAKAYGADIRVRTRVVSAEFSAGRWRITLEHKGVHETVFARALVNAAGPWVDIVTKAALKAAGPAKVRLVKGSHIVVKRLFTHDRCYFFQNPDGRIFFAIPYEQDFTLIGTTDRDFTGDPADARIADDEVDYLVAAANHYFKEQITPERIVWRFSGVRPLFDDGRGKAQEASRDYVLKPDSAEQSLTVYGGKLTTYRRLSEQAVDMLGPLIGVRGRHWTATATLPGGAFTPTGFDGLVGDLAADYPQLDRALLHRLARLYGTRTRLVLGDAVTMADLGEPFGGGLTARELDYLVTEEWATSAEDVLWRRTKLGLRLTAGEAERVAEVLAGRQG